MSPDRKRGSFSPDLYQWSALHAPEGDCISKGKARKLYEFGVTASLAVTHKSSLVVGARTFPCNRVC